MPVMISGWLSVITIIFKMVWEIVLGKIINDTFSHIKKMPLSASIAYQDIRYKVVDKFKYIILYKV